MNIEYKYTQKNNSLNERHLYNSQKRKVQVGDQRNIQMNMWKCNFINIGHKIHLLLEFSQIQTKGCTY